MQTETNGSGAKAPPPMSPQAAYKTALAAIMKTVSAALPPGMDAARLCAVFVVCAEATPALYECTPKSVGAAFVKCAYAGLYPSPAGGRGEIWLIPREKSVKTIRDGKEVWSKVKEMNVQGGYKGLCTLGYRGGFARRISANAIYASEPQLARLPGKDEAPIGIFIQEEPFQCYHRRALDFDPTTAGTPIGAYALVELQTGGIVGVYLSRGLLAQRAVAGKNVQADGKGWLMGKPEAPWIAHPADMCRKTALADLLNNGTVPLSPDVSPLVADIARAERFDIEGEWEPAEAQQPARPAPRPLALPDPDAYIDPMPLDDLSADAPPLPTPAPVLREREPGEDG